MNNQIINDLKEFKQSFELSKELNHSNILITGATGLIGSTLVRCLLALDEDIEITCPVRNIDKAKSMYRESFDRVIFVESDLMSYLNGLSPTDYFQYIIHCASPTTGKFMVEHPVETFTLAIESTQAILEHARKTESRGVVYVSSLEYYGENNNDATITEGFQGFVDTTSPRSSYPLGKRAAEYLCASYAQEYGVNVKIARLTQTFGAGVSPDDNRVFAQFARSVINGTDIVMHTKGESAKPYCYTTDCASAIFTILLKGANGEAYNVANQDTYISIRELAEFLRNNFNPNIKVIIDEHPEMGYAPVTKLNLSANKLLGLGWKPVNGLKDMFAKLITTII